jgi:hypothetical protein
MPELGSKEQPLYMKLIANDDGQVQWKRIVIALAVTALSGWLASSSQRWGGSAVRIDPKARVWHGVEAYANGQAKFWTEVGKQAKFRYDIHCL